jgi:ribose transport system permease protein
VVVISGGIDLSVSAQMALTSCIAATLMKNNPGDPAALAIVVGVLLLGLVLGAINGGLVVLTKVPDIVVTLATSFVWAGFALLVRPAPGGAAAQWLKDLVVGPVAKGVPVLDAVPKAAVVLIVIVAVIWIPLSRSRLGLSLYAIGSNRLAAFRSGVPVNRTKLVSYAIAGFIAAFAGLSLTASTGIGTPVPEPTYTLISIAAVVLGGVSLAGGVGGVFGPMVAVVILQLIRDDMTFMHIDANYGLVAQGFILIGVLVAGSLIQLRRARA